MGFDLGKAATGMAGGGFNFLGDLLGGGDAQAPQIDPQVSANAHKMSDIANTSYAWNLNAANKVQPTFDRLTDETGRLTTGAVQRGIGIGNQYDQSFMPVNAQVATDAMTYDSPAELERAAGRAVTDTGAAFARARGRSGATMAKYGINAGQFGNFDYLANLEQAKAEAGAANDARETRRAGGIQLRQTAAGIGSNVLAGANSTAGVGIGGASTTGNLATGGITAYNTATGAALPWYTGANNAMLGINQSQMQAYQAQQQADAAKWGGIGQLVGTGVGFMVGGPAGAMVGSQLGKTATTAARPNGPVGGTI